MCRTSLTTANPSYDLQLWETLERKEENIHRFVGFTHFHIFGHIFATVLLFPIHECCMG